MIAKNAEIKAQRVRRDKKTVQPGIDSDGSGGTRQTSSKTGSESFSADRDDRSRGNFINQCGQAAIGGIIDRLISKTLELIEESESRTAELKNQLQELKELSNQFREKAENP